MVVAAIGVTVLAGCSQVETTSIPATQAAEVQTQAIENNPNMPQDQKAAVIARLKAQKVQSETLLKQHETEGR